MSSEILTSACRSRPDRENATSSPLQEARRLTDAAGGSELASFSYGVDLAGHRLTLAERGLTGDWDITYGYDALYRLTSEKYVATPAPGEPTPPPTPEIQYSYDDVGNRLTRWLDTDGDGFGVTTDSAYDDNDQLVSVGDVDYSFDDRGRLSSVSEGSVTVFYTFDDGDRMVAVEGGGVNLEFGYDADGIRISRTDKTAGSTVEYLVDSMRPHAQVLEERDVSSGLVLVRNLHAGRFLGQYRGGVWSYALSDGLGSVRGLTNVPAPATPPVMPTVTDGYRYEGFGDALSGGFGGTENSYRFAGEQLDAGLGEYYLRARWMLPGLGSFASMDPWEGDVAEPSTLQRYTYSRAQPIGRVDPGGRQSVAAAIGATTLMQTQRSGVLASLGLGHPMDASSIGQHPSRSSVASGTIVGATLMPPDSLRRIAGQTTTLSTECVST